MLLNLSLEPIFSLSPSLYYMHRVKPRLQLDSGVEKDKPVI